MLTGLDVGVVIAVAVLLQWLW